MARGRRCCSKCRKRPLFPTIGGTRCVDAYAVVAVASAAAALPATACGWVASAALHLHPPWLQLILLRLRLLLPLLSQSVQGMM